MAQYQYDASCTPPLVYEGKAKIRLPEGVFYNRVQEFNRDLTVSVIQHFERVHLTELLAKAELRKSKQLEASAFTYDGIRILEALSATGIRAVRFALEIPHVATVIANDLDPASTDVIRDNVQRNSVQDHVEVTCSDAIDLMHGCKEYAKRFHVIDIDPFGTASPFLDAAMSSIRSGGLLCVTSTDMAVLCGSAIGTSMGKYGGVAIKNAAIYESGLRILLHAIQSAAGRYGYVIEPLISLSVDFYARIFVRVWHSPGVVKSIASRHGICYSCNGCHITHTQPLGVSVPSTRRFTAAHGPPVGPTCELCGSNFNVFGPLWIGPLHSQQFLQSLLTHLGVPPKNPAPVPSIEPEPLTDPTQRTYPSVFPDPSSIPEGFVLAPGLTHPAPSDRIADHLGTYKRIIGMLTMAYEELPDVLFCYKSDGMASVIGSLVPRQKELHSALLNAGYRVSCSHTEPATFKTDAPASLIWDVFLAYHRLNPVNRKSESPFDASLAEEDVSDDGFEDSQSTPSESKSRKRKRRPKPPIDKQSPEQIVRLSVRQQARATLLSRPVSDSVDFTVHPLWTPASRTDGLVRYQVKPEKFWGPKARPKPSKVAQSNVS